MIPWECFFILNHEIGTLWIRTEQPVTLKGHIELKVLTKECLLSIRRKRMCKVYTVLTHRFLHDLAPVHFPRLTFLSLFLLHTQPQPYFPAVVPGTHTKLIPASGSLHLLFSLLPNIIVAHSLTSFRSLLKCTSLNRPSLTKLSTKPLPSVDTLYFLEWFEVHRKIE